jgi:hypothetical protein
MLKIVVKYTLITTSQRSGVKGCNPLLPVLAFMTELQGSFTLTFLNVSVKGWVELHFFEIKKRAKKKALYIILIKN